MIREGSWETDHWDFQKASDFSESLHSFVELLRWEWWEERPNSVWCVQVCCEGGTEVMMCSVLAATLSFKFGIKYAQLMQINHRKNR